MGWPEKAALRKLTCKLRQEEWAVTGHMRQTEERAPSRGNDLDEDAGQERRRRGQGRGRWTERRASGEPCPGPDLEGHGRPQSLSLGRQGASMMGGHSGASGPIPHTWFMPSDHGPLSDIRNFPEEQLPTKASVWQLRLHLVTSPR